jgi:hypothetical protein
MHGYKLFIKKLLLGSVLDPFDVKTVFDHTGKEILLYPGVVIAVSNTSGRFEQFADTRMVTMQLPCNLYIFY